MKINVYLNFDGRCKEAFEFYQQCLGGNIEAMTTHADTPMGDNVSDAWRDRIMHARLVVGNQVLMGSDLPLGETFWAERFGMLIDRFGVPWMINCDKSS